MQKRPRRLDRDYLKWLRAQRCACGCLQGPPCDAAHLRASSLIYEKPITGMSMKPDDMWALPLKRWHHMDQTRHGDELGWWADHGVSDPFALCLLTYQRYLREKR
jgi:hypothetical protein